MYRVALLKRACTLHPQRLIRSLVHLSSYSNHHGNGANCHGYGVVRGYGTEAEEPFLNASSGSYIEAMYENWQADRSSVHKVQYC